MGYERLTYEIADGIATITVDRPKALNALDSQTVDELERAIAEVAGNAELHGAILTGGGEKAFVAGADISQLVEVRKADPGRLVALRGEEGLGTISACPRPVIACVNGYALGGGLELALACHFRYAVERAKLGLPEVSLGLIPGYGGTQRLSRAIGRGPATELILSGAPIDGAEALRVGLVNKLFDTKDAMIAGARETLTTIGKRGPVAVRLALEALERGLELDLAGGLLVEADLFGIAMSTDDAAEGLRAFLDKRKAEFKGC
jgi:enoyl-CoA hydratase